MHISQAGSLNHLAIGHKVQHKEHSDVTVAQLKFVLLCEGSFNRINIYLSTRQSAWVPYLTPSEIFPSHQPQPPLSSAEKLGKDHIFERVHQLLLLLGIGTESDLDVLWARDNSHQYPRQLSAGLIVPY